MEYFTPLLMVKDFNSTGFNASDEFMTNADIPTIAFESTVKTPLILTLTKRLIIKKNMHTSSILSARIIARLT